MRGLAGRPVRLDDALADWRAEIMVRLGAGEDRAALGPSGRHRAHMLPARLFMQLTRVLREAVSNVIKHSEASRCEVRCTVEERQPDLHRPRQRPRHRRRPAPRTGHVEHEAARQEDERPVPGRVAARVRCRDFAHGPALSPVGGRDSARLLRCSRGALACARLLACSGGVDPCPSAVLPGRAHTGGSR